MNVGGSSGQDFDLNLAPIIDCFTVLITFMLASASFLAVGIIECSIAATAPATADQKPAAIRVDVQMTMQKELDLKVSGKTRIDRKIAPINGDWNTNELIGAIEALKKQWPDTRTMVLAANDDVEYLNVVRVMEAMKSHLPNILLGGL